MGRDTKPVCKACQFCRKRKVKCDGSLPSCSLCRSQQRPCVYGEDGRHTAHASQKTIRRMGEHIAHLEQTVSSLRETFRSQNTSNLDYAHCSHAVLPEAQARNHEAAQANLSLNSAGINAIVSAENYLSLHSATSSFRDVASPSANRRDTSAQLERRICDWKLQLFATAALERQKEHAYLIKGNFELDGLDSDFALCLLNHYWKYQNNIELLVYRPAVMHSLATGGMYANKLLLNALYYSSALLCQQERVVADGCHPYTLDERFFHRFQSLLPSHMESSSIATISALLVMSSAVLSRGKQTLSFLYSGLAQRMIVDLGFHINPDKVEHTSYNSNLKIYSMTPADIEQQRRVFWGAFIQDRFQSLFFGRSPGIRLVAGFEPFKEILDTYDEFELWVPPGTSTFEPPRQTGYTPQISNCISNRDSLLELAEITTDLIDAIYTPGPSLCSQKTINAQVARIRKRLDGWAEQLPDHLVSCIEQDSVPPPHRFYPHTTHQLLYILLYKPFLPGGHLLSSTSLIDEAEECCLSSSKAIYGLVRAYRQAFSLRHAPFLLSYAIFCAATVIPLDIDTGGSCNPAVFFFWDCFKELQSTQPDGLKKPIVIIRNRFERAGINLEALGASQPDAANISSTQGGVHQVQKSMAAEKGPPRYGTSFDNSIVGNGFDPDQTSHLDEDCPDIVIGEIEAESLFGFLGLTQDWPLIP